MDHSAIFIPSHVWENNRLTWRQRCIVGLCLQEIKTYGKIDYEKCAKDMQTAYSTFCNMVSGLMKSGHIPAIREGHIYLMFSPSIGLHKIGFSKTPLRRNTQVRREFPDAELIWQSVEIHLPIKELLLHEQFHDKRKMGEWFSLSESDLATIKESIK